MDHSDDMIITRLPQYRSLPNWAAYSSVIEDIGQAPSPYDHYWIESKIFFLELKKYSSKANPGPWEVKIDVLPPGGVSNNIVLKEETTKMQIEMKNPSDVQNKVIEVRLQTKMEDHEYLKITFSRQKETND